MIFGSPVDERCFLVPSGAAGAPVGGHDTDVHQYPLMFGLRAQRALAASDVSLALGAAPSSRSPSARVARESRILRAFGDRLSRR
jgi:hypothetical protein